MEETISILCTRYLTPDGEPTCAFDYHREKVCQFLRTSKFGLVDVCVFSPSSSSRKKGKRPTWLFDSRGLLYNV